MVKHKTMVGFCVARLTSGLFADTAFQVEELDFSWMTSGWNSPTKNGSVNYGSKMTMWDGAAWVTYDRGIGVQSESHFVIRLEGKGKSFSARVGVNKTAEGGLGERTVTFRVKNFLTGDELAASGALGLTTAAEELTADLTGVEVIDLVVEPNGFNGSWSHVNWVDPVIVMEDGAVPQTKPSDGVNRWTGRGADDYWMTPENWEWGVPGGTATVAFDTSATVRIGETGEGSPWPSSVSVDRVEVGGGATVTIRPVDPEFWDSPTLIANVITGEGRIALVKVGLEARYSGTDVCTVSVSEIEMLHATRWGGTIDSWLQGGSTDGKRMIVSSDILLTGQAKLYGNIEVTGDIIVPATDHSRLQLDARATAGRLVYTGGAIRFFENDTDHPTREDDTIAGIKSLVIRSGVYALSENKITAPIILDGGTLDLGTADFGETPMSLSATERGGKLMLSVSDETFASGTIPFPQGLSFAEGTDLTKIEAIVKSETGAAVYAIEATEMGYAFERESGSGVLWIGGGADRFWNTAANWAGGNVPAADATAVFAIDAIVQVNGSGVTVSNIVVKSGVTLTLQEKEWWSGSNLYFEKMEGEGKVVLQHVGLHANNSTPGYTDVTVSEIEVQPMYRYVEPDWHRGDENDSWFESHTDKTFRFNTKFAGSGKLKFYKRAELDGDNSGYTGNVIFDSVSAEGNSNRHFATPESLFSNANTFLFRGKMCLDFTEGTAKLGTVEFGESWGASFELKSGADVTLEVADGRIVDSYFGDGFEVNGGRLTVKKVGPGTLVYGVVKAHVLEVTEGRVEFTGEGDDSAVRVMVRAGASIGNAPAQTSGNGTKTGGAAVTVHHAFTFDEGAVVAQTISADEDGALSVPVLTVEPAFDVTNVRFGFTNPELLPPVVRGTAYAKYPVADSPALTGAVRTVEDGIVPDGSARQCCWKAVPSGNTVIFRTYCPGFVVTVK